MPVPCQDLDFKRHMFIWYLCVKLYEVRVGLFVLLIFVLLVTITL